MILRMRPDDYTVPQFLDFIGPDSQQLQYYIAIRNDAFIEEVETFQLELFVAEQPHFLLGSITRVTVTIIDDDEREDEGEKGRKGGGKRKREGAREREGE